MQDFERHYRAQLAQAKIDYAKDQARALKRYQRAQVRAIEMYERNSNRPGGQQELKL